MELTTKEFENRIQRAKTADELQQVLLSLPQKTFSVQIDEFCKAYRTTFSQVQVASGITKSMFYAIVNGTRKPKKVHIIKIGLAMGLSVEEINLLLKVSGLKELYAKSKEDAIVMYGVNNNLTVMQIEELLTDAGATLQLIEK